MSRVRQLLRGSIVAGSLLAATIFVAAWVHGRSHLDLLIVGSRGQEHGVSLLSTGGRIAVGANVRSEEPGVHVASIDYASIASGTNAPGAAVPSTALMLGEWLAITGDNETDVRRERFGFVIAIGPDRYRFVEFGVPAWFATLLALGPALLVWRGRRRRRRMRIAGRCLRCGYDLRGSPERCPECGTAVAGASTPTLAP